MSLDRSLRASGGLARHRNVLSRAERIAKLSAEGKFVPSENDPLGLPKLANRKLAAGKTTKKKKGAETEEEAK
ncbi:MAG: small basic protein [Phycisphaeraceae bacterium]